MKYLLISFLLLILLAIIGSLVSFQAERDRLKNLKSETSAQIVEMSPRKTIDPETGQTNRILNVLITYRYSINGEAFERQRIFGTAESWAFKINQPAKVCFNPNNPEQADLFPAGYICNK